MVRWTGILVFPLYAIVTAGQTVTVMDFTCARPTTPCVNNGACDDVSGLCSCPAGTRGLRCEVTVSDREVNSGYCQTNNTCVQGLCYDQGNRQGSGSCICPAGYYGDRCQLPMLDVDCHPDKMLIYVLPWGYDETTWILGSPVVDGLTAATLETVTSYSARHPETGGEGRRGFVGDFHHVSDTLAGNASVTAINASTASIDRTVQVTYGGQGSDPTDQVLRITCFVPVSAVSSLLVNDSVGPNFLENTTPSSSSSFLPTFPPPGSSQGAWTCQRPSTPCVSAGSTCNVFSGHCHCAPGLTGLQCNVSEADVNAGECTTANPCNLQGGVCYDSGQGATCSCLGGYYGDRCQHPVVFADCQQDTMVINVFPYGFDQATWSQSLRPSVYQQETCRLMTVHEVVAVKGGNWSRGWQGFVGVFLHANDPCAGYASVLSQNTTTTVYGRQISIDYSPTGPHHTDQLIDVSCPVHTESGGDTTQPPAVGGNLPDASMPHPPSTPSTGPHTTTAPPFLYQGQRPSADQGQQQPLPPPRVEVSIADENGVPVNGTVKLGSMVMVTFSLDPLNNRGVTDLRVDRCVVFDNFTGETVIVVNEGCVQRPMGMLLYWKREGVRVLIVKIFKFSTSADISFRCSVRMCAWNDSWCSTVPRCASRYRRAVQHAELFPRLAAVVGGVLAPH